MLKGVSLWTQNRKLLKIHNSNCQHSSGNFSQKPIDSLLALHLRRLCGSTQLLCWSHPSWHNSIASYSEQFHRVLLQLAVFGTFKCRQPRCCRCSFCGCIHLPDSHYGCCNLDFCRLDYDSCGSLQRQAETPLEELVGKRLILWEYM